MKIPIPSPFVSSGSGFYHHLEHQDLFNHEEHEGGQVQRLLCVISIRLRSHFFHNRHIYNHRKELDLHI
jgi:hypothetical protein